MAKLIQRVWGPVTTPDEPDDLIVKPFVHRKSGQSEFTSNADGTDSGSGVTGVNFYGGGVFVDPPVNGVLGVYVPAGVTCTETIGGSAPDVAITMSYALVQPSGGAAVAVALPAGRSLVFATLRITQGSVANSDIRARLYNITAGAALSNTEIPLGNLPVSTMGELEITATVNLPFASTIGVQVVNNSAVSGSVNMVSTRIQAIVLPSGSASYQAPYITNFSPNYGLSGTAVTITGAGFSAATAVQFGGVSASSFTVNSDTQITAIVAAGSATGTVTVASPPGAATALTTYYYQSTNPGPGGVASGLVLWLKADAIAGLSNGSAVSSWLDSSSCGNNASQSTGGNQPVYDTNVINSHPALRFTSANKSYLTIADNSTLQFGTTTIFGVFNSITLGDDFPTLISRPYYSNNSWTGPQYASWLAQLSSGTSGQPRVYITSGGTAYYLASSTAPSLNSWYYITLQFANPSALIDLDTTNVGSNSGLHSGTIDNSNTGQNICVGTNASVQQTNCMDGYIAEVIVYNRALLSTEITSVQGYLHTKYGI